MSAETGNAPASAANKSGRGSEGSSGDRKFTTAVDSRSNSHEFIPSIRNGPSTPGRAPWEWNDTSPARGATQLSAQRLTRLKGLDVLRDPFLNKGTAFTERERDMRNYFFFILCIMYLYCNVNLHFDFSVQWNEQ